jgi:hypothetical protein
MDFASWSKIVSKDPPPPKKKTQCTVMCLWIFLVKKCVAMKDKTRGVFDIMRFICCVYFVSKLKIAKSTVWKVNFGLNKLSNRRQTQTQTSELSQQQQQ